MQPRIVPLPRSPWRPSRSAPPALAFAALVIAAGAAAPARAAGQDPPVHALEGPTVTYPEGLGSLRGARELPDGRVLIADGLGEALIVWRPGAGADTLANVGQGPREYRVPDALHALPGGATLLVDIGNARLHEIGPDLAFGDTEPIARPGGDGLRLLLPIGTDAAGRIYYEERPRPDANAPPDSATIRRLDTETGEDVALGKRKLETVSVNRGGGPSERRVEIRPRPLTAQDAWAPADDGRVAVARAADYHLEWIGEEGGPVRGPPVVYDPVRVRAEDKKEWLEALASGGLAVTVEDDGSGPRTSFRRGMGRGPGRVEDFEWPRTKPPFPARAVTVAPDGHAWVRRHVAAGERPRFDVFDARGRRVAQVLLPDDRSLVGFGSASVYLRWTDEVGFDWLERHSLPEIRGERSER